MTTYESRPGGAASEGVNDDTPTVARTPDITPELTRREAHDHEQAHIDHVRRIVARPWHIPGYGLDGCQHPRRHEPGCLWHLDPEHRVQLAAATVLGGFPAPRLSLEREFEVIVEVHADKSYAARVFDWISSGRAG